MIDMSSINFMSLLQGFNAPNRLSHYSISLKWNVSQTNYLSWVHQFLCKLTIIKQLNNQALVVLPDTLTDNQIHS